MTTPPINQQITFIYTSDLSRAAGFYEDVLGLALWRDQTTCRIYRTTETSFLGVCQVGEGAKGVVSGDQQTNIILTLITDAVDDWYDHLRAQGVTFEKPPEINLRYNIYHCFLRDPDGYLIEIQRFLD